MLERRPIYVLDAGHGGFSRCEGSSHNRAEAHGLEEKDLALDLAKRVQTLLAPRADVQLTRYTDVNLPLAERARIARDAGADAFVSLHFNSSVDPHTNETNAWIASSANAGSRDLAARLAETVARAAGARTWGVGTRDLGVLVTSRHNSETRACLLEVAHLSNPDQAARLQDMAFRNHLARAIAGALDDPGTGGPSGVHLAVLEPHQPKKDTAYKNAILRWILSTPASQAIKKMDVAVHIHGFVPKDKDIDLNSLDGYSGIRFEYGAGTGARKRPRNTLGIHPMGLRKDIVSSNPKLNVVNFPVLVDDGKLDELIASSLKWLAENQLKQTAGSIQRDRLILTAHSGGVDRVARMLDHGKKPALNVDPNELHLFDGVYGTDVFTAWAKKHIKADADALAARKSADWPTYMSESGGALRCVFGDATCNGGKQLSEELGELLRRIASDSALRDFLGTYYRSESTEKDHYDIPRSFGPQVMTKSCAEFAGLAKITCKKVEKPAAAKALDDVSKVDILATLRGCKLVPASVKTMADYESTVLKKGKVFGLDVTLHPDFLAKVKAAESDLGKTPHGVTEVSSYRSGATTYHGWGLAIDLNPGENPYVMHEAGEDALDGRLKPAYHRIAWLMNGEESLIPDNLSTLAPPKFTVSAAYLALQKQSAMVPVYFALLKGTDAELQKFIDAKTSLAWKKVWGKAAAPAAIELRSLIEADYKVLHDKPSEAKNDQPFKHIDPKKTGFLNLSLDLVKAMKDQSMRWGAIDLGGACGDMMHFDDGLSALGKLIYSAKKGGSTACPATSKASSYTLQAAGTPAGLRAYVLNPKGENDAGLSAALRLLEQYKPAVDPAKVSFQVTAEKKSRVGNNLSEKGHSMWDGTTPAIFLLQEAYDAVAEHVAGTGNTVEVHEVIRTIGHEMHHLWRGKIDRAKSNPIDAVYRAEADRRLEKVRENWLDQVKHNPHIRSQMKIPAGVTVTKWTDIPAAERDKIEKDASDSDYIQGLHDNSTYLVEEMYTLLAEIGYLRAQQKLGSAADVADSRLQLTATAKLLHYLNNVLHSVAGKGALVTPELLAETVKAMPAYLRTKYPNAKDNKLDSYTVIFFLSASERGLPPLFDSSDKLVSKPPTGARVP